jgi:hypothetical protein
MTNATIPIGTVLYFYHAKFNMIVQVTVSSETKATVTEEKWNSQKNGEWFLLSELFSMHLSSSVEDCLKSVWDFRVNTARNEHAQLVSKTVETYPQIAMVQ